MHNKIFIHEEHEGHEVVSDLYHAVFFLSFVTFVFFVDNGFMHIQYETPSPFHLALIEPEIPPNTGNIARTCLATFTPLHLVGQLGFRTDRRAVMRAGLDYWYDAEIHYHRTLEDLELKLPDSRFLFIETGGPYEYTEFKYAAGDVLVLGRETKGLPPEILEKNRERCVYVPMPNDRVRSLNLATTAGVVLYEALRQIK